MTAFRVLKASFIKLLPPRSSHLCLCLCLYSLGLNQTIMHRMHSDRLSSNATYESFAAQVTIACNGLIETIGRVLDGEVKHPIIAHPKKCPDTRACLPIIVGPHPRLQASPLQLSKAGHA